MLRQPSGWSAWIKTIAWSVAAALFILSEVVMQAQAAERAPVTSMLEMRQERVVMQEWDLSCGAAALATVLRYQHGEDVSEREVALALIDRPEYLKTPEIVRIRQGFSLLDMQRYVEKRGYVGRGYGAMTFEALLERAPVIVPVDLLGYPHFVVFRGIASDRVLLADPAFGTVTMTRDKFERAWIEYGELGRVGFVVSRTEDNASPPGKLAPRRDEFVLLR